jgi:hypothetical protein
MAPENAPLRLLERALAAARRRRRYRIGLALIGVTVIAASVLLLGRG